ncbi:Transcriptional activator protein CzcR [Pirellula sp. SH-Sr6A]|uniref:response regulator transcription factor n=1 Tax=Pirellula sp. SH-Sr6A TaxID=1632865 RepID=UPI00078D0CFF|nr:response regulator transcription factor [Pirellula sp. SH-Sr6A]AMV31524.1 Transcriptional activator protein CzcR [Pirellula sp. SH-Sr6A]
MRILVIEDQPELRRLLYAMLDEEGYAVDLAADGEEGRAKATTWSYDAIVLDLMLPKLDGWKLLGQLRETHKVPVLILSARDGLDDRVRGLDLGADDYLAKPFERSELMARLRALIRRSAGQSSSSLRIGNITIDLRARQACVGDELVSLTAREFGLLEYLAVHRGKVISRREIYEHLFDELDDPASNIVDVYISYLRRKLGTELIETRRGQGYVIS